MMQSLYSAKLGMMSQQKRVDTIANNIANINTIGYKSKRVDFKDALYSELYSDRAQDNLDIGNGILVSGTTLDTTQGIPKQTGETLDLFVDGDGYFTLQGSDGTYQYTRNGAFNLSSEPGGQYLVSTGGQYVLDTAGQRISVPTITDLSVSETGELFVGSEAPFATLGIVTFPNRNGLSAIGQSSYTQTDVSGAAMRSDARIRQGVLESSNVDFGLEMTRLIRAQRAFSLAGKAITTVDDMDAQTNSIRR